MTRRVILVLLILIFIAVFAVLYLNTDSVSVYIDGENVSVKTHSLSDIDKKSLNVEICNLTRDVMNDTTTDVDGLKNGIGDLCRHCGMKNPKINIDSSIGENQIPVIVYVDGTSMVPTLKDGQTVLFNKTHNIHVGDIVVADSDEYGGIIKGLIK